jgi:hypothetical protein
LQPKIIIKNQQINFKQTLIIKRLSFQHHYGLFLF